MTRRLLILLTFLLSLGGSAAWAQLVGDMAHAMAPLSEPRVEQAGKKAVFTFAAERVESAFNGVVVQGFASAEGLEGWIRFEEQTGRSDWHALYLVRSATDAAFMAAYRGTVFRTRERFERRFDLEGASNLELVGAGVFDNRKDADRGGGGGAQALE